MCSTTVTHFFAYHFELIGARYLLKESQTCGRENAATKGSYVATKCFMMYVLLISTGVCTGLLFCYFTLSTNKLDMAAVVVKDIFFIYNFNVVFVSDKIKFLSTLISKITKSITKNQVQSIASVH